MYSFELFDSFVDSIAVIDKKGTIIFTNIACKAFSCKNYGSLDKTDIGTNYLKICNETDGEEILDAMDASTGIQAVIDRRQSLFEMEYPCHSHNEQRWFILRCTPVKYNTDLSIISHINITQRKIAEETVKNRQILLRAINKRLETTLYKVVHDIQTPLNSVIGLIYLSREEEHESSIDEYLTLIDQSIHNLKHFIQETLKVSFSSNQVESVSFSTLLNDFQESIKYYPKLEHIEIITNIIQTDEFYTYKNEITTVITNLVGNSLKYHDNKKEKSTIHISIESNNLETKISIKDNGIGIGKDLISKIFDMKFQINNESKEGSGIGLSLVKQSVELMCGVINVNSELGMGTEFNIIIPNLK